MDMDCPSIQWTVELPGRSNGQLQLSADHRSWYLAASFPARLGGVVYWSWSGTKSRLDLSIDDGQAYLVEAAVNRTISAGHVEAAFRQSQAMLAMGNRERGDEILCGLLLRMLEDA